MGILWVLTQNSTTITFGFSKALHKNCMHINDNAYSFGYRKLGISQFK